MYSIQLTDSSVIQSNIQSFVKAVTRPGGTSPTGDWGQVIER